MDIFESKFNYPWPNWKKVPMNIRDCGLVNSR